MPPAPTRSRSRISPTLIVALALLSALLLPGAAIAGGGVNPSGEGVNKETVPGKKAKLEDGRAIAPEAAPEVVKRVIAAANRIRNKPYRYGGGHGKWNDSGYDCSGAVSYALRGGGLLSSPLDSSGLARWGERNEGKWITVYGAPSHAYMVVAGLRFDTSMTPGNGPGWSKSMRSVSVSYQARHPRGL